MRAATRKVRWWVQRGLMPPDEVILHKIKVSLKKRKRVSIRELVQHHSKGRE